MINQVIGGVLGVYILSYTAASVESMVFSFVLHGCVLLFIGFIYRILREAETKN